MVWISAQLFMRSALCRWHIRLLLRPSTFVNRGEGGYRSPARPVLTNIQINVLFLLEIRALPSLVLFRLHEKIVCRPDPA